MGGGRSIDQLFHEPKTALLSLILLGISTAGDYHLSSSQRFGVGTVLDAKCASFHHFEKDFSIGTTRSSHRLRLARKSSKTTRKQLSRADFCSNSQTARLGCFRRWCTGAILAKRASLMKCVLHFLQDGFLVRGFSVCR